MESVTSRVEPISVNALLRGIDEGHIFAQGLDDIGRNVVSEDRGLFISSLMAGVPVAPIYFDGTTNPWQVLDGEKRLALIWGFAHDRFKVEVQTGSNRKESLFFKDLPQFFKRRFLMMKLFCYVINPPTSKATIEIIKNRIKKSL